MNTQERSSLIRRIMVALAVIIFVLLIVVSKISNSPSGQISYSRMARVQLSELSMGIYPLTREKNLESFQITHKFIPEQVKEIQILLLKAEEREARGGAWDSVLLGRVGEDYCWLPFSIIFPQDGRPGKIVFPGGSSEEIYTYLSGLGLVSPPKLPEVESSQPSLPLDRQLIDLLKQ